MKNLGDQIKKTNEKLRAQQAEILRREAAEEKEKLSKKLEKTKKKTTRKLKDKTELKGVEGKVNEAIEKLTERLDNLESGEDATALSEEIETLNEAVSELQMEKLSLSEEDISILYKKLEDLNVRLEELQREPGPQGPQGEKGESIVGPMGPQGKPGKDGVGKIGPMGPAGRDGRDGKDSKVPGPKGEKGDKGNDGSPDTAKQIIEKINDLSPKSPHKIDFVHIKNFPWYKLRNTEDASWGGFGQHDLLSSNHGDVTTGTVVRGDLITGQGATATWTRLAIGAAGTALVSDGTDVSWGVVAPSIGGSITGGTTGSVLFVGSGSVFAQDNPNFSYADATNVLTVTGGLISPKLYPAANSTTAIQILKADGTTAVVTVDTTNNRVGIGTTSPGQKLEVSGNIKLSGSSPWIESAPTAWGSAGFIQFGVDENLISAGDYLTSYVPSGKGFSWAINGTSKMLIHSSGFVVVNGSYTGQGAFEVNGDIFNQLANNSINAGYEGGFRLTGGVGKWAKEGTTYNKTLMQGGYEGGLRFIALPSTYNGYVDIRNDVNSTMNITNVAATNVGLTIKGAASQSAPLLALQDSSAAVLSVFGANGKLALNLTAEKNPILDINGGVGTGLVDEAKGIRIRSNGTDGNCAVLLMGASNVGIGGLNQGHGYIQSAYWGGGYDNPLRLQPQGGGIIVGNAGLHDWSMAIVGEFAVRATSDTGGALSKIILTGNTYNGEMAWIGGEMNPLPYRGVDILFATITGADVNGSDGLERARLTSAGRWGFMTSAPDKQVEINSEDGNNLRLTYNDANGSASNYTDFTLSSSGDLTITPSGGDVSIAGKLAVGGVPTLRFDVISTAVNEAALGIFGNNSGNNNEIIQFDGLAADGSTRQTYGAIYVNNTSRGLGTQSGYMDIYTTNGGSLGVRVHISADGKTGFGTTAPDKQVEINSANGNNLRLTYNDADGSATNYADLLTTSGGNLTVTPSGGVASFTANVEPATDNTYYLGRNDDDSPKAWKGVILKDTTDGKYYRIEVISGVVTATDLTD